MPAKLPHLQSAGQIYQEFQLVRSTEIPELQCHLYELIHLPTHAQVMHIANDDPENLFCLSFQTLPYKSDGAAHILEHTVLCGSKKFPVKEPFFAMTRRSLNTFMNALTGSDFTCYPASTQINKDFYNLLEVYLDAVFHPILDRFSFLQEGHRLEFAIPDDPSSPLEHKGVVFNEMKGALSSPASRLSEEMHAALFPNITYGINSGGNPRIIPELTYEELRNFHKEFYHPSRCLFFFCGNMSLEKHLDFISKHALEGVEKIPTLASIPLQTRFTKPRYIEASYPISPDEDPHEKTFISFGWLTSHVTEQEELLALSLLEMILMDTDASLLKMPLLKSGFCKLATSHIDTDISENPLMITLRGCNPENADECEKIIRSTLEKIATQGIPLNLVENALHQLEFHRSEITGDHSPFGLSLFFRSALLKQHHVDPERGLKIHSLFEGIHQRILQDPFYLSSLIKKHLLENPHFVRIVMTPDKELNTKELNEEQQRLNDIKNQLTPQEVENLVNQAEALARFQKKQEEEDIDVLPKVSLEDVPKTSRSFGLIEERHGSLNVFHHSCFTNKIVYADLVFNLPELTFEDLPYVRLFCYLLTQMGSGGRSYAENLEYIQAHTGGVGTSLLLNLQVQDYTLFHPYLTIRGKALHRKAHKLFPLFFDLATSVDFTDHHRLTEVLKKHYTALESNINQNAMQYAINLGASGLDIPSGIANQWHGLNYFWSIKQLVHHLPKEIETLIYKLKFFQEKLLCLDNPDLIITCEAGMYDELKGNGFYGLSNLETHPYKEWKSQFPIVPVESQGRIIASPVAFIGKVFKTVSYTHPQAPALATAACLFDNLVLHKQLREVGGAYGGGSVSNASSGNFYFYAYRDPHIVSSLQSFEDAIDTIAQGLFEESDLEEAKLEIIQSLDNPIAPGSRGVHAYGWLREGKTLAVRQSFRNQLLSLTRQDVIDAVNQLILSRALEGTTVVFAGKELLEKENAKSQHPLPLFKI